MTRRSSFRTSIQGEWITAAGLGLMALLVTPTSALAIGPTDPDPDEVTFSRDVAPILQRSCQVCHNPEGMAPMALMTYEQVRPWSQVIKSRVSARAMPPWHIDPTVGIQHFKNDISLSEEEIATIVQWAEAGAPEGNPADMPAPLTLRKGTEWELAEKYGRPPDMVVKSKPYTVGANSQDQWWSPSVDFGELEGPRWVMASEFKPAYPDGIRVVHHGHATLDQAGPDGKTISKALGRYGVGKPGDVYPEDTGILITPGGKVNWNLHYFPIDKTVVDDVVEIGLWLYPEAEVPRFETTGEMRFTAGLPETDMPWAGDIVLPPHSIRVQQGVHVLDRPAIIHSYRPHMHMRGKEQSLEVIYPDGRKELISRVDNYSHFWQIQYQYADEAKPLLPKGTILLLTTTWDNTADNPINPDPDQWVVFGQRGVDEMSHAWIGITYLDDDSFSELVTDRDSQNADN